MVSPAPVWRVSSSLQQFQLSFCRRSFMSTSAVLVARENSKNGIGGVRLSRILSQATNMTLSRREAERLVRAGQVTWAGETVTLPQMLLDPSELQTGQLKVRGKPVAVDSSASGNAAQDKGSSFQASTNTAAAATTTRVWLVHKIVGEVVTEHDPQGRPSLMERLMRSGVGKKRGSTTQRMHLKPIGRLDMSTEGLILVTNDGEYARQMELPSNQLHRSYRVRTHGFVAPFKLERIRRGLTIEGVHYKGMQVAMDNGRKGNATNNWVKVTCVEGKNRQIRKVFQHLGLTINRLIRISYGDYQLQTIPPGLAIEVPVKPIKTQRHRGRLNSEATWKTALRRKVVKKEENASLIQWVRYH